MLCVCGFSSYSYRWWSLKAVGEIKVISRTEIIVEEEMEKEI